MESAPARPHRVPKSGPKAEKKKERENVKRGLPAQPDRHNPRAFSVSKIGGTKRNIQRNLDRLHKKEVVPQVDRTEALSPPPCLVAVMGPPRCGKSTLIRSLVKVYTGQMVTDVSGPITVVANKQKRLTFFEVPADDLNAMIDIGKTADLVLLMLNGSFGFEMETFEFLNLLQAHGFPKVMGICTHLDHLTRQKALSAAKKQLKHRFWTEVYQGAKMFYFSGVINGKYLKMETRLLTLQISRLKFRPLSWRNQHPYLLVDRVEDITPPHQLAANPTMNRSVVFYGYTRGAHLKKQSRLHLIGVGDFGISEIEKLADPCPLPESSKAMKNKSGSKERSSLKAKDTLLYAPMSNVGSVKYDQDATYIDLSHVRYSKADMLDVNSTRDREAVPSLTGGSSLLKSMQDGFGNLDKQLDGASLDLFGNGGTLMVDEDDEEEENHEGDEDDQEDKEEDDDEDDEEEEEEEDDDADKEEEEDDDEEEEEEEEENSEEEGAQWKANLASRAESSYRERESTKSSSLFDLIYGGDEDDQEEEEDEDDDEFFRLKGSKEATSVVVNDVDSSKRQIKVQRKKDEAVDYAAMKRRFVTGDWGKGESNEKDGDNDDDADEEVGGAYEVDSDEDVYGDFEDLETGESFGDQKKKKKKNSVDDDEEVDEDDDDEENESDDEEEEEDEDEVLKSRVQNAAAKALQKLKFDVAYDDKRGDSDDEGGGKASKKKKHLNRKEEKIEAEAEDEATAEYLAAVAAAKQKQSLVNNTEFSTEGEAMITSLEGFRNGNYVRIVLDDVPMEFTKNFRPSSPVVLGGVVLHESRLGLVRCRVRRHRWHKGILKSNDPLVVSCGWRRFQTVPVYCMEESEGSRHRYLKYTPQHMHCQAVFYAPLCPPNTPLLGFKTLSSRSPFFRVSLTGVILELDHSFSVMKKLKLTGTPLKVYRNTAFIRGMFNSALEVAKFEGAKIRTVSGLRGEIKKSFPHDEPGTFRATFEDKILISDIVSCRLWVPVTPTQFYLPVTSLLAAPKLHAVKAAPTDPSGENGEGVDWENAPENNNQLPMRRLPANEDGAEEDMDDELDEEAEAGWSGMRTTAELRRAGNIPVPLEKDSLYKPVTRVKRVFNTIPIPKKVEAALPFASKSKNLKPKGKDGYLKQRAVVSEPDERKRAAFLATLGTIRNDKIATRKASDTKRQVKKAAAKAKIAESFALNEKATKKKKYRTEGLEERARKKSKHGSRDD